MTEPKIRFITVGEANALIKSKLEGDPSLKNILIKGEISNWKPYSYGAYFDLKEGDKSLISCTMWNNSLNGLGFVPKNGDEVLAYGSISVYAPRGRYNFNVYAMQAFGLGEALLRLEELKKKLAAEGLFDEKRKRKIPLFPKSIGVIVGKGSAAEADIIKNCQRRWPMADLYIFNSLVQGADAPKDLLKSFEMSKTLNLDTLIIARGGGSSEDLSAFNDEALCRAIADSPCPTIAAVGHEVDFTLVDFVADKRVSTPTGAAEAATPDKQVIEETVATLNERMTSSFFEGYNSIVEEVERLASRPFFKNPSSIYSSALEETDGLSKRLDKSMASRIGILKEKVEGKGRRLDALNPYGVLKRGYTMATDEKGKPLTSVDSVKVGDIVKIKMKDGTLGAEIREKGGN